MSADKSGMSVYKESAWCRYESVKLIRRSIGMDTGESEAIVLSDSIEVSFWKNDRFRGIVY